MIETTIPEINVSELMERIRAKVDGLRQPQVRPQFPSVREVKEIARAIVPKPVIPKTEKILRSTQAAREATTVSRWIPKPLRVLFWRQASFNRETIRAIESLTTTNAQFADRLQHLTACVEIQDQGIQHLAELRRADAEWMKEGARIFSNDADWIESTERLLRSLAGDRPKILRADNELAQRTAAIEQKITAIDEEADKLKHQFDTFKTGLASLGQEFRELRDEITSNKRAHLETADRLDEAALRAADVDQKMGDINGRIAALDQDYRRLCDQIVSFEQAHLEVAAWREKAELRVSDVDRKIATIDERLAGEPTALRDQIVSLAERLRVLEDHVTTVARFNDQLSIQTNHVYTAHTALAEAVSQFRGDFDRIGEHVRNLQAQADAVKTISADLQGKLANRTLQDKTLREQLQAETAHYAAVRQGLESLEQRHTSDSAFLKAELSRQSKLVHNLTDRISGPRSTKTSRAAEGQLEGAAAHHLDAFYFSFENRFRGPRAEIKRRLGFYLPLIESTKAGKPGRPILDLGCGRGEWLELLGEHKLEATGVDLNQTMIDQCKERRLRVAQSDALEFLEGLPDNSHGAITGFHIIEHLPLDTLINVITETFRVLSPGGLAIFESPNCKNLTVGACSFFIDPTHRHPVFPETAQFMLEGKGFERVSLEYLQPVETTGIRDINEGPAYLRDLLYGPRDFGVIGYKPSQPIKEKTGKR